eukprot:gb/GEZN01015715.1/.p1 GENE.gb/GEZN01015715.1/~~gb/GEZN01015715.1/.p1  ORF type:complete len:293 (+),score=37.80 gb/GEZN01015715.1/:93-881(+)
MIQAEAEKANPKEIEPPDGLHRVSSNKTEQTPSVFPRRSSVSHNKFGLTRQSSVASQTRQRQGSVASASREGVTRAAMKARILELTGGDRSILAALTASILAETPHSTIQTLRPEKVMEGVERFELKLRRARDSHPSDLRTNSDSHLASTRETFPGRQRSNSSRAHDTEEKLREESPARVPETLQSQSSFSTHKVISSPGRKSDPKPGGFQEEKHKHNDGDDHESSVVFHGTPSMKGRSLNGYQSPVPRETPSPRSSHSKLD